MESKEMRSTLVTLVTIALVGIAAPAWSRTDDGPPRPVVDVPLGSPVLSPFLSLVGGDPAHAIPGLPIVVTDIGAVNCPVDGEHTFVSSWGFSRSGGRLHQGNDLMAARHTPLVAVTNGVVSAVNASDGGLGGRTIWLESDTGATFYYAHLESIATGIEEGDRVSAGTLIGTVGNSGNARGSGTHLHFEIHPSGSGAMDPYPILVQVCGGAE
jgi:murein DD-endopeptidase MepM/ murein hydrolase activator NlpD